MQFHRMLVSTVDQVARDDEQQHRGMDGPSARRGSARATMRRVVLSILMCAGFATPAAGMVIALPGGP